MRTRTLLLSALLSAAVLVGCASTPPADRMVYATSDAPPPAFGSGARHAEPAAPRPEDDLDESARRAWIRENAPRPAPRPRHVVRERVIVRERSVPSTSRERPWYRSYALPLFLLAGYGLYRAHRHYDRHHDGHHDWHVGVGYGGYHHW